MILPLDVVAWLEAGCLLLLLLRDGVLVRRAECDWVEASLLEVKVDQL